jgi:hypothetical protein
MIGSGENSLSGWISSLSSLGFGLMAIVPIILTLRKSLHKTFIEDS